MQSTLLYLYCFSISMESIQIQFFNRPLSISFCLALLFILSLAVDGVKYLDLMKGRNFFYPLFSYALLVVLVSFFNINWYSSKVLDLTFIFNVFIFIVLLNYFLKNGEVGDNAILIYATGAVLVAVLSFLGIGVEYYSNGRVVWNGSSAGKQSIDITIALGVMLATLFKNGFSLKIRTVLLSLGVLFLIWFVVQTGTRTALVLTVLILFTIFLFCNIKQKTLVLLVSFCLVYFYLQSDIMQSRVLHSLTAVTTPDNDALGGRLYRWYNMWLIAKENILIGYGLSGAQYEVYKLFGHEMSPHNAFLDVLLNTGIIGLFFYIIFISKLMFSSYWSYKYIGNYLPVILMLGLFGYLLALDPNQAKVFWLVAAYIVSSFLLLRFTTRSVFLVKMVAKEKIN